MTGEISWGEEYPIHRLFSEHDYFRKGDQRAASKEEVKTIALQAIEAMGLPNFLSSFPEDVYNEFVLEQLSILLWNSASTALRLELSKKNVLPSKQSREQRSTLLKGRILGPEGNYPSTELRKDNGTYSFRHGIPFLVTDDSDRDISKSELSFLNEVELRFAAAIVLSPEYPRCDFYFDNYNVMRIDRLAFKGFRHDQLCDLMFEFLHIKAQRDRLPSFFSGQEIGSRSYRFDAFDKNIGDFDSLYDAIDTKDQLTMRTLFYLVKSRMLWANMCFGEDAISNVFFCIEGALLLLQRKEGHSDSRINTDILARIFRNRFERGEELFDFVREAYDKRVSIVHANPKSGVEWTPFLMADDFYEYFDISRMLLVYILLDRIIDLD